MTISAHIADAYAHLTIEQLEARQAERVEKGKKLAALVAKGVRGEPCGSHVLKGRWVTTYSNESALNFLRFAWKQENAILKMRLTQSA